MNFEGYVKSSVVFSQNIHLVLTNLKMHSSRQINESPGFDGISFTVLKNCFGALHKPFLHIFNLSIVKGIFPDNLKIARVTPVFKGGDEKDLGNYRPISFLSCFTKILETIMYN